MTGAVLTPEEERVWAAAESGFKAVYGPRVTITGEPALWELVQSAITGRRKCFTEAEERGAAVFKASLGIRDE